MKSNTAYCRIMVLLPLMLLLVGSCERIPVVDQTADADINKSSYQGNVVKLDSLVFTNPVRVNGSVRFDLVGTPPAIKAGDIIYYPGGDGVFGSVTTVTLNGSRMFFQLGKAGLDKIFRNISFQDSISKNVLRSRMRIEKESWKDDTLDLDGIYLFNDFWQSKSLIVQFTSGKLYSGSSVGQFILSGQGSDPWFDRCRLDVDYSLDVSGEVVFFAASAMDARDSLLAERSFYGPFLINGFPVTYRVDTWLGFHLMTEKDTVMSINLAGLTKGNLSLSYNHWETWEFTQVNQDQSADLQVNKVPRLSGYVGEIFIRQIVTPYFCGEASLSVTNYLSSSASYNIDIPDWQSLRTISNGGTMLQAGTVFSDLIPEKMSTGETVLFTESGSGIIENQPPKANFVIDPPDGFTDTNFEFDASSSSDLESPVQSLLVRWDFDGDNHFDTEYSTTKVAYYKYPKPGVYSPVLEVRDPGDRTGLRTASIEVSPSTSAPVASFTVTPESGRISDYFVFNAYGCYDAEDNIDQLKIRWDFDGDGVWDTDWSTNKIAIHFYKEENHYMAKLEVLDTQGLTGSTTKIVIVAGANIKPTAIFTVDPESGTTETRFTFDASGSSDPEDLPETLQVRWDWDNDGIYDTGYRTVKTIQHVFTVAGTYTVVLEVIDTEGYGATYTREVKVTNPNTPPNADFTITPETGTVDTEFIFDVSISTDAEDSTGQLEVRWDWNNDNIYDTGYSADKVYKKKFTVPGTYIVKVEVRDSGGLTDTKARLVVVE